jgi:cardiolipin synthase
LDYNYFGVVALLQTASIRWLNTGTAAFDAMVQAIRAAHRFVRLETYIYRDDVVGQRIRSALIEAANEGVCVQVLVDAWGSEALDDSFWAPLRRVGGECRWFNPLQLDRIAIRNHRKLLVCDDTVAIIGGFNVAAEYAGDGVHKGWQDLGISISGPKVGELCRSFDQMFQLADFRHGRFAEFRRSKLEVPPEEISGDVLLNTPGRGRHPIKTAIYKGLAQAKKVQMVSAYFLPTWRIRRALQRIARHGGQVQLILAGKTDVPLSQAATRSLYHGLMRAGVEIYEYQPQILHAKLYLLDDTVMVGSSNLDKRSLGINYELMVRSSDPQVVRGGRNYFEHCLAHSKRVNLGTWLKSRSIWLRMWQKAAYMFLVHLDPYIARQQLKMLR